MQKYSASSSQTQSSGVTCGRPSARTVESQDVGASFSRWQASSQPVGFAVALLNRASSSATGSLAVISALPSGAVGLSLPHPPALPAHAQPVARLVQL